MVADKSTLRLLAMIAFWAGYLLFPYISGINVREELECIYPFRYAARAALMWAAYFSIGVFVAIRASSSLREQSDARLMYGLAWALPTMMSLSSAYRCP